MTVNEIFKIFDNAYVYWLSEGCLYTFLGSCISKNDQRLKDMFGEQIDGIIALYTIRRLTHYDSIRSLSHD